MRMSIRGVKSPKKLACQQLPTLESRKLGRFFSHKVLGQPLKLPERGKCNRLDKLYFSLQSKKLPMLCQGTLSKWLTAIEVPKDKIEFTM